MRFVQTAGPALERKGDIAAFLTALEPRAVFFVDEIHRLTARGGGDLLPGDGGPPPAGHGRRRRRREGRDARPARLHADRRDHARRPADHAAARPLRDPAPARALRRRRPGADRRRSARVLDVRIDAGGARAIAERARGTPRVANRLLQARARLRAGARRRPIDAAVAGAALDLLEVDHAGSTGWTARSSTICEQFAGGPVGLSTLAVAVRRGARHDRGRLRALPAPARLPAAHAARALRDRHAFRHLGLEAPGRQTRRCSDRVL